MDPNAKRWKAKAWNVAQVRTMAKRALPRPVFDFSDGGAEDEFTLRRNQSAFDRWSLVPRPLNGAGERDLSVTLFGKTLSMPVMIGPTGLAGLFHPDGERCSARAAAAAGTGYCLSHGSVCTLEDLAATGATPRWMQVFVYKDRSFTRELADRAAAADYDALVVTIDNQIMGQRERDIANGFKIPPEFSAATLAGMMLKAPWLWQMRNEFGRMTFGNYARFGETSLKSLAGKMSGLLDTAMNWADIEDIRSYWSGPLIIKGVLHADEAKRAIGTGADGLIVSNHGGRQLDGAVSSVEALPAVLDAADGKVPVLLDGGIRRGRDVVKALALGATACLIARPQLWGLAMGGEDGVHHVLELYRAEIDRVMALSGFANVKDIDSTALIHLPILAN